MAPRASHALSHVIFTMSLASFLSQPEVAELPRAKIKTKGLQGTATNKDSPSHTCLSCSIRRKTITLPTRGLWRVSLSPNPLSLNIMEMYHLIYLPITCREVTCCCLRAMCILRRSSSSSRHSNRLLEISTNKRVSVSQNHS